MAMLPLTIRDFHPIGRARTGRTYNDPYQERIIMQLVENHITIDELNKMADKSRGVDDPNIQNAS